MPDLGTRKMKLEVDGNDFTSSVSNVQITSGEADTDFLSFADADAGGAREYKLVLTMKQNTESAALWRYIWDSAGDEVDVVVRPNGGTTAGTTTPQFLGTVVISEPDGTLVGGESNVSTSAKFVTEVEWAFTAKPTLDETP